MDWSTDEKAAMFDEIAAHYYNRNYGTFSKSDMDLLMFSFFLDNIIKDHTDSCGVLDYNSVSDYKISQELCITQQRVKSLKIKKQLMYPIKYDWKTAFATLLKNARYDSSTQKIVVSIPDPNLLLDIQDFIEEKGGYISTQINSKLLQVRVEYFIELSILVSDVESRKSIIKGIKKTIKDDNKDEHLFDSNNIGKSLLDIGVNITSLISNISSLVDPKNAIFNVIKGLLAIGGNT